MSAKLTMAQRKTLEWFAEQRGPVHLFSAQGPTLNMRRWAERCQFIAGSPGPNAGFGRWIAFSITPAGHIALATKPKDTGDQDSSSSRRSDERRTDP